MKKSLLTLAIISAAAAPLAMAEQPSFNYVEGGYSEFEDFDGYTIRGKVELTDYVYANGSYSSVSDEFGSTDFDINFSKIGVGVKLPLGDSTAVYTEVNYLETEFDNNIDLRDSDYGHSLSLGVRSMVTDATELYGEVSNVEFEETNTHMALGARQYITDNLGVFAEYTQTDFDFEGYNIGVTYKF